MSISHPLEQDSLTNYSFGSTNGPEPRSPSLSIKNRYSFDLNAPEDSDQQIHHLIQPDDTLEGICVMYRANVAEVKRLNRLWTNDSIHLRKILQIPATKPQAFQGRPLSLPTRPQNAFQSLRAESSNGSIRSREDQEDQKQSPHTSVKERILNHPKPSTRELIDLIDRDVSLILKELKKMDWSIPTSPLLDRRPKSPGLNFKDLRSKTARVTITPLDPKASKAFISSDLVPLKVVFTLTPLLSSFPESVQTSVKKSVLSKLKSSLSSSFLNRLAKDEEFDMVVISDKSKPWNNIQ
jgi:hypothetical protein